MAPNKAFDFGKLLRGVPPGARLAISSGYDRVVACNYHVDSVFAQAKRAGEKKPIIIRVPEARTALVF
jgi:hypothetical protein